MALITCKNLCIGYSSYIVQKDLNFEIEKGDYFYIIGENGSGKSTLLKTILGFNKPVSGKIEYSSDWDKKKLGYLSQQTDVQKTFPATVKEVVLSGCQSNLGWWPFYRKSDLKLVYENLDKLGILKYADISFRELSGGQQQRVLLVRTLCSTKSILILDEPTKGFDSEISEIMYDLLIQLNKTGVTIITISHDLNAAEKYGTKILKLNKM